MGKAAFLPGERTNLRLLKSTSPPELKLPGFPEAVFESKLRT
jgi:hypothetical protein